MDIITQLGGVLIALLFYAVLSLMVFLLKRKVLSGNTQLLTPAIILLMLSACINLLLATVTAIASWELYCFRSEWQQITIGLIAAALFSILFFAVGMGNVLSVVKLVRR
jgi:hypothetical protein